LTLAAACLLVSYANLSAAPAPVRLKLVVPAGYLSQVPVLVRVEALNVDGGRERGLWDADATLASDQPGVSLSTNRVRLRNGLGSSLVTITGTGDFNLSATLGSLQTSKLLVNLAGQPVTSVGGTLPAGQTVWSGVVRVTSDVTIPAASTLTILSNTLVLVEGVASGTTANDFFISGTINSLGTEDLPVTITCATAGLRWGQIRHNTSQPSLYRHTIITRGGRATGEGHTGTAPVMRPTNSRITFDSCSLTDYADETGGPGKIGEANGSDLTFINCLFQRARMGPEVQGTAMLCTNTWILDMHGPDDSDGIYVHDQSAGQQVLFSGCVVGMGDDDGIDTLGSVVTIENCIVRGWNNLLEDAKAISVLNGAVHVRRSLIVDSTVGIAAKSGGSTPSTTPVLVTIDHSTLLGNGTNLYANRKSTAVGPHVLMTATNSILWAGKPAYSDFEPNSSNSTNFVIRYCALSESYAGAGNIVADPMFVDATAHDFHLRPYSPCIDSGDPAALPDLDGSPTDQGWLTFQPPRPVLRNPQVLLNGTCQFVLDAYTNRNYVIESSADASSWSGLMTVPQPTELNPVVDITASSATHRLYRARLAP
jgi:hypothetical protein